MPTYATTADLALYGLNAVALEGVPTATQTAALDAASSVLDGYFAGQATLPLVTWGIDVKQRTCEIAAFTILVGRGYNPEAGADQTVKQRADDAIKWAEHVAAGNVSPQWTDSSASATAGNCPDVICSTSRGWSRRGTSSGGGGFVGD